MNNPTKQLAPGWVIALISIPIFIGALDLTVVSAVLPQLIYDLGIPVQSKLDDAAWIVSGYLLAYSVAMTFMGRLSDIYGRRKVFLLALAVFAAGSLMVAVADTWLVKIVLRIYYLFGSGRPDAGEVSLILIIISRMVQAFGGGAMVPVGMALVGDIYPAMQRGRALGIVAAIDTAGWVVGHLYGGIVVRYLDWRMIFWLNIPVCILAFILIAKALRQIPKPTQGLKMDWLGALLISVCLTALNIAIGSGGEIDLASAQQEAAQINYPALILFALFLGLFIWQQARSKHPLIHLGLFRKSNFSWAGVANFLIGTSLFIAIANVPFYINSLVAKDLQQGAWDSGWLLSALTVPMALAAFPGGWLTERKGYRMPAVIGLGMAIFGFWLMSQWQINTAYTLMIPQLALTGIGFGLVLAPLATAVVNAAPEDERGVASAMVLTFRLIGMTLGVSGEATYGLRRANVLTNQLIQSSMSLAEQVNITMDIVMQVIGETFLIAGALCLFALIPAILLKKDSELIKEDK